MICAGQYMARLCPAALQGAEHVKAGQPCAACHMRSGAASAAAITHAEQQPPAAPQAAGVGEPANPTASAATRKPMFHLASQADAGARPDGQPPAAVLAGQQPDAPAAA